MKLACLLIAALLLGACAATPKAPGGKKPSYYSDDGPPAVLPDNLEQVPDAEPRDEPFHRYANRPYTVFGQTYTPVVNRDAFKQRGLASWYGKKFQGQPTASGEPYDMFAMTAAHKTLPIPSYARVRNPANGKEVIVRVNDRGPFSPGRVIDLSYTAALRLGVLGGVAPVEISRITQDDIRTGAAFRKGPTLAADAPATVAVAGAVAAPVPDAPPVALSAVATVSGPDLGAAAVADAASAVPATMVAAVAPTSSARPEKPDEHARADTTAGIGWWIQLGAFRQRDGALDFQRRLIDEQPWLAPLLAVFSERGLNKLQAGPYVSRDDATSAAAHVRMALQLVPTLVEKK
jgi:rare lipoprotein A